MSTAQLQKDLVLNSWKEIAAYLGRGVRTVQRYERELGLPVRRPHGRSRSSVIAMADELDAWLRKAPRAELESIDRDAIGRKETTAGLRQTLDTAAELRSACMKLRDEHVATMASFLTNFQVTMQCIAETRNAARSFKIRRAVTPSRVLLLK